MGPGLERGFESPSEIEPNGLLTPALFPPDPFRLGSSTGREGLSEAFDGEAVLGSILISTFELADDAVSTGETGVFLDTGVGLGCGGFRSGLGGAKRARMDGEIFRMMVFEVFCLALRAPDAGGETLVVGVAGDMIIIRF